ncbi:MAG: hypothetical protein DCF25_17195 [Leptolyngbya foveolarum]|uniref:NACHT conflict system C-terminal helical domain-containing protein n=1 Tax=Leptolyngbya foveolarum TaxID=47253 RepID=A0A2W4TUY8_9CYAN|nr:MAG: hypothetical protein DCF25_17195 [Leptolyngbya foveolarum]
MDNNEWKALVEQKLTDNRWREILLLLPGLMAGKTGADSLLLAIEKQANDFIIMPKLKSLVRWAELSTADSKNKSKPSAKRVGAIFFARTIALDLDRDLFLGRDFDFDDSEIVFGIEIEVEVDLARALDFDLDLDFDFDLDLDRLFEHSEIFNNVDFSKLVKSLESLQEEQPSSNATRIEQETFVQKIYDLWFSTLGIEAEAITLTQEESDALDNYFYACELMIRCKEGAERVSPEVWAGIESRILTVPKESEAIAD